MSKRSFLYSAALVGLMAATGAVSIPSAQAQKGMALQPASQWAINKIEAANGQSSYCAMAQRFRPNTILTIARNLNDEASLALDFQTPKFRQAEGMQVLLDPGAGQQRAFEVYPVSNQAFVVRLGQDGAFFSALEKTGYLRVEFGDKSYNFDLSDIDAGQVKLASCVSNSVMPAAGDQGTPVMSDNSFQRDIDDLRRQIALLQETNRQLEVQPIERLTQEYEMASAESDSSGGADSVVIDQLSQQITALEEENQELQSKMKAINGGSFDALRSEKDVKAIERLTQENQGLREALENEQASDIQATVLSDQITELQEENLRLRGLSIKTDASGVDPNDILSLIQENERLKEELTKRSAGNSQEKDLRNAISALEEENRVLKASKAPGDKEALENNRRELEQLKAENKRLQNVVQSSEVTGDPAFIVRELKGQVSKLSTDMQAKEGKLLEMSKLTTEVEMLKTTNEELEKQLVASALRGPVHNSEAILTEKVAALETQNDALLQKIQDGTETVTENSTDTIESLKSENEELKRVIASSEAMAGENKTLQEEVQKLRTENDELKAKANIASQGDLGAQLQKAQDDNKTLQAQLEQKDNEINTLRTEVERLKKENDELKMKAAAPADPNAPVAAAGTPNPEVETLHRENEQLRAQIAGMGSKDSEISDLKTKLQEQETKIAAADEKLKKAEEAEKTAKADAEKKAGEAKAAKAAQKKAQEEIKAAKEAAAQPAPAPEAVPEPVKEEIIASAPGEPAPVPGSAVDNEMIRLENKLSEAKASGDQMAIQKAARDYMKLKSQMSATQELSSEDQAKALLEFSGTAQAPVGDVAQADTMAAPASEDLLRDNIEAVPTSNAAPMNEAQRQEEALKNAPPVQEAGNKISMSEDPYADMKVENDFKGYESSPAGNVSETKSGGPSDGPSPEELINPPAAAPSPAPVAGAPVVADVPPDLSADALNAQAAQGYNARMNDARMVTQDSVRESYAKSKELMTDGKPPMAPPPPASAGAEWAQATPASAQNVSAGGMFSPDVAVPQLLGRADIVSPGEVTVVKGASGTDKLSYQWKAKDVYGSAVQKQLSDPSRFDGEVKAYLDQTKQRCGNDFAVIPDETSEAGGKKIATYEIACVGQGVSSSASLIFFSQQGTFTVLAHETPADQLDSAMEIRDRLLQAISDGS